MDGPRVTLVTPVYNGARFLAATIESVLAQTWRALDYVVVDDGSTDATPAVIAAYAGRLASARHANRGQAATLNAAWRAARGHYLGYLSADDVLAPGAVARMVAELDGQPGVVCAYPDYDLIGPTGRAIARGVARPFSLERLVLHGVNDIGPGALFRADAFARAGGWPEHVVLGADDAFWMRMAALGELRLVPERLASYRIHARALSRSSRAAVHAGDWLRIVEDYFARPDVPARLRARRHEALAGAHRRIAQRLTRAGRVAAAARHLAEARRLAPASGDGAGVPRAGFGVRLRVLRALLS